MENLELTSREAQLLLQALHLSFDIDDDVLSSEEDNDALRVACQKLRARASEDGTAEEMSVDDIMKSVQS